MLVHEAIVARLTVDPHLVDAIGTLAEVQHHLLALLKDKAYACLPLHGLAPQLRYREAEPVPQVTDGRLAPLRQLHRHALVIYLLAQSIALTSSKQHPYSKQQTYTVSFHIYSFY